MRLAWAVKRLCSVITAKKRSDMQLPEHVELCPDCGCAPVHDMKIPKWVFLEVGDCWCEPTEDTSTDAQEEVG